MSSTVQLSFPAQTVNVALARTVAAAMAARADLPIDQLEDVRLAVDEAVSQLIADAVADASVSCAFTAGGGTLEIRVSARTRTGKAPATDTFSWTVMQALVDSVIATTDADEVILDLHVARALPVEA